MSAGLASGGWNHVAITMLRRLADDGNDEAERQLAEFIRDFE